MTVLLVVLLLLLLAALGLFFIAPARASERMKAPFIGRNYAHRGLYKEDQSPPENSLAAFEAAMQNGYGVELDVQLTADNEVVVFHDDTLERLCGLPQRLSELSWGELRGLRLAGSEERIPLLSEALELLGSRTPIILELKKGPRSALLCEKTLAILDRFRPMVCVESFDAHIVRWFRRKAPDLLRGQLACPAADSESGPLAALWEANLLCNFLSRPHFIAYKVGKKPFSLRLCQRLGAMLVLWTARDWEAEKEADAVIFEYYRPRRKFPINKKN